MSDTVWTPHKVTELAAAAADFAHREEGAENFGHRNGFCEACARVYTAVNASFPDEAVSS